RKFGWGNCSQINYFAFRFRDNLLRNYEDVTVSEIKALLLGCSQCYGCYVITFLYQRHFSYVDYFKQLLFTELLRLSPREERIQFLDACEIFELYSQGVKYLFECATDIFDIFGSVDF